MSEKVISNSIIISLPEITYKSVQTNIYIFNTYAYFNEFQNKAHAAN